MDITNTIAANVKAMREQKKLTLDIAAEVTGVSRSMLAQIEKGDVNPTISVLWKIANGYKVSFTALVEQKKSGVDHIKGADIPPLTEDDGRYRIYPTFSFDEQKLFEVYRVEIDPRGALTAQPHMKGAEEFITVFSGTAEITVDENIYRLKAGDSIRFYADVPHGYRNAGLSPVQMTMMIYYNK
ncbi:MAG: helix-turn-helix transcriptional regulator [Clostridia bacterium]|nr:helix-turn-helix transcriptional regulator [Clostridia bacterium]